MQTSFVVDHQGDKVTAQSEQAKLYFDFDRQKHDLGVYVPIEDKAFLSCYYTELPAALARLFELQTNSAEKQIFRILTEPDKRIDALMDEEDIPRVLWLTQPDIPPLQSRSALHGQTDRILGNVDQTVVHSEYAFRDIINQDDSDTSSAILTVAQRPSSARSNEMNRLQIARENNQASRLLSDENYRELLRHVVKQAKAVDFDSVITGDCDSKMFPKSDSPSPSKPDDALNNVDNVRRDPSIRSVLGAARYHTLAFDEYAKIGAAGELFVSNLFSKSLKLLTKSISTY